MGRRKRCLFFVCFFPVFFCVSYVFSVYSIYKRNAQHIYEYELHHPDTPIWLDSSRHRPSVEFLAISNHHLLPPERLKSQTSRDISEQSPRGNGSNHEASERRGYKAHLKQGENYIVVQGDLLTNEGDYLGRFRTDVDRTEERKRKKKRKKFKRGLKEKCKKDVTACEELKFLQEEEKNDSFHNGTSMNASLAKAPGWSSYADKGFTIVGKKCYFFYVSFLSVVSVTFF